MPYRCKHGGRFLKNVWGKISQDGRGSLCLEVRGDCRRCGQVEPENWDADDFPGLEF